MSAYEACTLIYKVDVIQPVTIHVRHSDSIPMVVMNAFVVSGGVIHGVVDKGDSAVLQLVCEMKLIEDLELVGGLHLRLLASREGADTAIRVRKIARLWAGLCKSCAHSHERKEQLA